MIPPDIKENEIVHVIIKNDEIKHMEKIDIHEEEEEEKEIGKENEKDKDKGKEKREDKKEDSIKEGKKEENLESPNSHGSKSPQKLFREYAHPCNQDVFIYKLRKSNEILKKKKK